jgi:hypothetical protein
MKTNHSTKSKKNKPWFIQRHWSYIPISSMGWITYLPFIAFLVGSFYLVGQHTNSTLGAFFDVFPYWVSAVVIMHWFANHKS